MKSQSYWSLSETDLLAGLGSEVSGLTSTEAANRLNRFGANRLQTQKSSSALGLFVNQFKSPIILILLFATLVSAFLRDWIDSIIILLIVLGSAALSFWQEYNASNAAEKLRSKISLKSQALRDNQPRLIPTELIVPGDVVLLSAGSLIPADGVVLEARD
ncbi:MAG: cation-transporting P-type ATPase, partial [Anaerolineaceae bacterium]|nr:cation-transporting P-type ATPase [Anaerolineaceae bacterium]